MTRCPPRVQCRGVVPAVSHIMLHSDTLANEFNDILNAAEIFAPFQPLDPAVTFYAPLRNNTRDLRLNQDTFERGSDAWYKDGSGIYRNVGINRARFEANRLLMEPARTNKSEAYNANPDPAFTNLNLAGDPAAVLRRVDSTDALAAAGLNEIAGSGLVIELDASACSADARLNLGATTGNTNQHAISCWARELSGQQGVTFRLNDNSIVAPVIDYPDFRRTSAVGTPGAANSVLQLQAWPPAIAQIILWQLEESPVLTSPIITQGTAGSRGADNLDYGVPSWINDAEGMVIFDVFPQFSSLDFSAVGIEAVLAIDDGARFIDHWCPNDTIRNWRFRDNVPNTAELQTGAYSKNELLRVAVRWRSGLNMQIGVKTGSGAYVWSPETTYSGSFMPWKSFFSPWHLKLMPARVSDLIVYNEDRGTAWIEANYP